MKTIKIEMNYSFFNIFKFFFLFIFKFTYIPTILITYILLKFFNIIPSKYMTFTENLAFFIVLVIYSIFIFIFLSFIISLIISILLKNNRDHTFIFDKEGITHIRKNITNHYKYSQFKKVYSVKRYLFFKRINRFYINTDSLTTEEKNYIINHINKRKSLL